jgi:enoyl-CoA hydratase/carnithine racemase
MSRRGGELRFDQYADTFHHIAMTRSDGILEVALHSEGKSVVFNADLHAELPEAFARIGADRGNRVVIITGVGDTFIGRVDDSLRTEGSTDEGWDRIRWQTKHTLQNLLNIEVPVIGAINGPARIHAELGLLSDIVLAAEHAYFQDLPHLPFGVVPGDGVHVIWPMLLGPNRGRYFLLTGEKLSAQEARRLGVVAEVLPAAQVLGRARELAATLAAKDPLTVRYARLLLTQRLKRELLTDLGYGLALEGLVFPTDPALG